MSIKVEDSYILWSGNMGKCIRKVELGTPARKGWYGIIFVIGTETFGGALYWTRETWGSDFHFAVKRSEQSFSTEAAARKWSTGQVKDHYDD